MLKTAIFDLDGTLADTINDLADAVNYGLAQLGCPVHSIESYKQFVGNGAKLLCQRALPENRKSDAERLYGLFSEYYSRHYLDRTRLYPGIRETVDRLAKNGIKMAVATNKPQDAARRIAAELLPEIDFVKVLGGCDERPKKPDPTIIRCILSELPEDNAVFMIGDSNVDIQTARNAGIISVGCVWGFRGRAELESEGADFIAEAPGDIADIILH